MVGYIDENINLVALEAVEGREHLTLTVGIDDPSDLLKEEIVEKVWRYAFDNNYWFLDGLGEVKVYGQNYLCRRTFVFSRTNRRKLPLEERQKLYRWLVEKRKACRECVLKSNHYLKNPKQYGKDLDTDEIGHWSKWKSDLDAKIVVVGQDWNDEKSLIEQKGEVDLDNYTNRQLKSFLNKIGVSVENDKLFFTNAILCIKRSENGKAGKVNSKWTYTCGQLFLRPLLEIIQPPIVIALGKIAYDAILKAFDMKKMLDMKSLELKDVPEFKDAVDQPEPIYLTSHLKLFPVYHCGRSSYRNRSLVQQEKDWMRIKEYLEKEG